MNFIYKGLRESQLTMKNKKEKTAQSDLIDDVYDSNEEVNDWLNKEAKIFSWFSIHI